MSEKTNDDGAKISLNSTSSGAKITLKNIDLGKIKSAMNNYREGAPVKPSQKPNMESNKSIHMSNPFEKRETINFDKKIVQRVNQDSVPQVVSNATILEEVVKPKEMPKLSQSSIDAQKRSEENRKRYEGFANRGIIDMNPIKKRPEKPLDDLVAKVGVEGAVAVTGGITRGVINNNSAARPQVQKKSNFSAAKSKKYDDEQEVARKKRVAENLRKSRLNEDDDDFEDLIVESEKPSGDKFEITAEHLEKDEEKFFGKALTFVTEKSQIRHGSIPRRQKRGIKRYDEVVRSIEISGPMSVKDLAHLISEKASDVLKVLIKEGFPANINATLDPDTAEIVATSMGHGVLRVEAKNPLELLVDEMKSIEVDSVRVPIVAIMGHVDHGKTSLLDYIRKKNVAAKEAGGITQHIGAYTVDTKLGKITFLDTPGHAAFSKMRSRGANLTDISILIIAADDGIQPQTIEAIKHIKNSNSTMIVVINKVDKDGVDIGKIKQDLLRYDVLLEEFGGDVIVVPISAKTGQGVDKLLETISLQAEMLDLSCASNSRAFGVVIESKFDKNLGSIATIILKHGKLSAGDIFIAGKSYAKIKYMTNDLGEKVKTLEPGIPVEVFGFETAPSAGDNLVQMDNDKHARSVMEIFADREKEEKNKKLDIADLIAAKNSSDTRKNVNIILKTDAFGSLEAISEMIETIVHPELHIKIISKGVGNVTESDITYAKASHASIICFNVQPDSRGKIAMQKEKINVKLHSIVYKLLDEVKMIASSKLGMIRTEKFIGKAEIKQIFETKTDTVAGCYVESGSILLGGIAKISKKGKDEVFATTSIKNLKRFKDSVKEVKSGHECGIMFSDKIKFEIGDVIQIYEEEFTAQKIED